MTDLSAPLADLQDLIQILEPQISTSDARMLKSIANRIGNRLKKSNLQVELYPLQDTLRVYENRPKTGVTKRQIELLLAALNKEQELRA